MSEIIINSPKYGTHKITIDEDDSVVVKNYTWNIKYVNGRYSVRAWRRGTNRENRIQDVLHIVVIGAGKNDIVYFIDGDWKNCRKNNLKVCKDATYINMGHYHKIVVNSFTLGTHEILFDSDDLERVSKHTWIVSKHKNKEMYAVSKIGKRVMRMHNFILGQINIDHKNCNGIDNRKSNLRLSTTSQNNCNKAKVKSATGFKGVYKLKNSPKFWAYVSFNGKRYGGGTFDKAEDAAKKYNELALIHHGNFAKLNSIK